MADAHTTSLKFACACGKRLAVPRDWSGRRVRCPQCRAPIVVPAAAPPVAHSEIDDLFPTLSEGETILRLAPVDSPAATVPGSAPIDSGDGKTCPSCGKKWPKSAKICVACGIDLKTGRAIEIRDDDHLDRVYMTTETIVATLSWAIPFGIFPVTSEAFGLRKPWVIRAIAAMTTIVSVWYFMAVIYEDDPRYEHLMLMQWSGQAVDMEARAQQVRDAGKSAGASEAEVAEAIVEIQAGPQPQPRWYQPFTCALLHGGIDHLVGNLLFLIVLGTRVNMLIGNTLTLIAYPLLALISGLIHAASMAGQPLTPSLGASGAIMGLAGMYFVLLPITKVHMVAWLRWGLIRGFHLSMNIFPIRGLWVLAAYIALDVFFLYLSADDQVAHWAHIGGFLGGVALALVLLLTRLVDARGGDLLSVTLGRFAWKLIGPPSAKRRVLW